MKKVIASVSLIPNLLQHTLVGLEIGGFYELVNPQYANEYKTWFSTNTRDSFSNRFKQLKGISSSTWFALLYQIPAYLADDNIKSLIEILDLLGSNAPLDVIDIFPQKAQLIEKYIPKKEFHQYIGFQGLPPQTWHNILKDYSNAIQQTYEESYVQKWDEIRPVLEKISEDITSKYLENFDQITWWESQTQIEFPYPLFKAELIDSVTSMGTSLLAERDGFFAHSDPLVIISMISHEIGTHMFYSSHIMNNDLIGPLMRKDMESYLKGLEVISWATNRKVMEKLQITWVMQNAFEWLGEDRDTIANLVNAHTDESYWGLLHKAYNILHNDT